MSAEIPQEVQRVTDALIGAIDSYLPGQLDAFYLTGSVSQGDYRSGQSDIDFVAVLRPPIDLAALLAAHMGMAKCHPAPACEGIYLRPGELSRPPHGVGIAMHGGQLLDRSLNERHPAVWLMLADQGLALRGRKPDRGWIAADPVAATAYARQNLGTYWQQWIERHRMRRATAEEHPIADEHVVWGALGIARVAATIATGKIPSKTDAGAFATQLLPHHARIVGEAVRLRVNPDSATLYRSMPERQNDLIKFMDAVMEQALAQAG